MRIFGGSGRRTLLVLCAVALAAAVVLPAVDASAFSQPIGTKISLVKPTKLYKIVSKPAVAYPIPAYGAGDPLDLGGSLKVTVNGGELTCNLAAGLWKGLGNPPGSKGWKYINTAAPSGSACKLVLLKTTVIKVLTKATGSLVVNDNPPGNSDLSLELTAGSDDYCALATPPTFLVEKAATLLKAKGAPAPADCGAPPTTTTIETTTTTTGTAPPTTTTTSCDCSGFSRLTFETGIGSGVAGVLSSFGCSNYSDAPCVDDGDCNFGTCFTLFHKCWDGVTLGVVDCDIDADCVGTCVESIGGGLPLDLKKGGLYTGSGLNAVPLPFPVPDQGLSIHNASGSSTLTLTATTQAQVGKLNCTQGRTCTGGGNDGLHCVLPSDCPAGTCTDNCVFGPPLPIPNAGQPATSVCAVNVVDIDSSGTAECAGGDTDVTTPLRSMIYLNGDLFKSSTPPDLPGVQPCPICVRICSGGTEDGLPCRPDNNNRACVGGDSGVAGRPCTDNSDCPGPGGLCAPARTEYSDCINGGGSCPSDSECLGGPDEGDPCTPGTSTSDLLSDAQDSYPTSHDCANDSLASITDNIGGLPINFGLTSGTMEMNAVNRTNQTRVFCGFCRDMVAGASLCFKGDTRPACPPAIPPADGNAVPCTSDADCLAAGDSYESCIQRDPGAFSYAAATRITVTGETDGECMQDGLPHPSTLVSIFCVPPTFDQTVDGVGDLPGPGAALLVGEGQLLP